MKRFPFSQQTLVLASSSPRRHFLLDLVRIPHRVVVPRVREEDHAHENPIRHVRRLARLKALSVRCRVKQGIILGADTIVVLGGDILEKPRDKADAARMLKRLAGHWHQVYTGLALVDAASGRVVGGHERSLVKIRRMTASEIDAYIATGEPMDKAGAYGIQGYGAAIVEKVNGCYFNVVGLPIVKMLYLLRNLEKRAGGGRGKRSGRAVQNAGVAPATRKSRGERR